MPLCQYDIDVLLPQIVGPLRTILDTELARGNSILAAAGAWPQPKANIWLARRFADDYRSRFPNLTYTNLNDCKNWIEDYTDHERGLKVPVSALASSSQQPPDDVL